MVLNKKAQIGEQIMVFPFLFILVVICVGIAIGVYIFFGGGYDFRQVDADILSYKIGNCILDNEVNEEFWSDLYTKCRLNKEVLDKYSLFRVSYGGDEKFSTGGDFEQCGFKGKNEKYPQCSKKEFVKGEMRVIVETTNKQSSRRINA